MRRFTHKFLAATLSVGLWFTSPLAAQKLSQAEAILQAKNLYERIARTPGTEADIIVMANLILQGKTDQAAFVPMNDLNFYKLNLKKMFTSWSNLDQASNRPLNDMSATLVGYVKDDRPIHGILHESLIYTGKDSLVPATARADSNNPLVRMNNNSPDEDSGLITALIRGNSGRDWQDNNHYEQLESRVSDWPNRLQARDINEVFQNLGEDERVPPVDQAGILTQRSFSMAAFEDGTNRRQIRLIADTFLCRPLEKIHDTNLSFRYVRPDIEREPDGDSRNFRQTCVGCHAGMDAMANAFIRMDFEEDDGKIEYRTDLDAIGVENGDGKLFRFSGTPPGFDPRRDLSEDTNNTWWNLWSQGQNADLGWRVQDFAKSKASSVSTGVGAKALGAVLASTEAFSNCMVKRAFINVCGREPTSQEGEGINGMARKFEQGIGNYAGHGASNPYNLKAAFAQVSSICFGSK